MSNVIDFNVGKSIKNRINSSIVNTTMSIDDCISGKGLEQINDELLLKEIIVLPVHFNDRKGFFGIVTANVDNGLKIGALKLQRRDGQEMQILSTSINFSTKDESFDLSIKFDNKAALSEFATLVKADENTSFVAKFTSYRAKKAGTTDEIAGDEGLRWSISYVKQKTATRKIAFCYNKDIAETNTTTSETPALSSEQVLPN